MSVERITLRVPLAGGRSAASCSSAGKEPCKAATSAPSPPSNSRTRKISLIPGRKTRMLPSSSATARRIVAATWSSSRPFRGGGVQRTSTGWRRPSLTITGAASSSPRRAATRSASIVADMTSIRRSGRRVRRASYASARPRSVWMFRSWNSSNSTAATPGRSGSRCSRRVRTPSVTTSTRVAADRARSVLVTYPTVSPTGSPSNAAIRRAAALVANRRGSNTRIRPSPRHGSSRSRNGTTVVLPAPGGATRTPAPLSRRASRTAGMVSSIGSPVGFTGPG